MQRFTTIMFLLLALVGCNLAVEPPLPTPDVPSLEFLSPPTEARVIEGATLGFDISASVIGSGIINMVREFLYPYRGLPNQRQLTFAPTFYWRNV